MTAPDVVAIAKAEERAAIVTWLRTDDSLCDCSARSEGECACGAWSDYKQVRPAAIADRIEAGEHIGLGRE